MDRVESNLQTTGVKGPCPLNDLPHFHIIENAAWDIMHDILEGICPLEVKLVLKVFLRKKFIDLNLLNARFVSFNYSTSDLKNKPVALTENFLNNTSPGQNAAQMWCLIRYLPLVIGDCIPEDDLHWDLLLLLLEIMSFIFAPTISQEEIIYLKCVIQYHHALFLQLFKDEHLKPKHHFMVHYPSALKHLGPLLHMWVMRFEAKHNFSRRLSHVVCNFKNIQKTLAYRNQINLCCNMMSRKTFNDNTEIGPGSSMLLASVDFGEIISQAIHVGLYNDVFIPNWYTMNGTNYESNQFIIVGKLDSDPLFGRIVKIVIVESGTAYFVYEKWNTVAFVRHFNSYEVVRKEPLEIGVTGVDQLLDFIPLQVNTLYGTFEPHYITLRNRLQ